MQRIEKARLDTDLLYRFQYLCDFIDFGEEEISTIKASAPLVAPLVPTVVDVVYNKLFQFDVTKSYFVLRNEGFKGKTAKGVEDLDTNNEQIKFRKEMLSRYLTKLVSSEYDEKFLKYLDWVGKIHTDKVGSKSINVEYIHVNALMGYVEDILINAISDMTEIDAAAKKKTIRAFNKLLWIQNDLFARHYIDTDAEKEETRKKILATVAPVKTSSDEPLKYGIFFALGAAVAYGFLTYSM